MVRVNLLPVRASKKKETIKQQVLILIIAVAGILLACGAVYSVTIAKISATKDEIKKSEDEIKALKAQIGEIDNIKKLQLEVRKKLDVLSQLRKEKTGPATRLARLGNAVPEKLWLTKYTENGANLSLNGIAYNEELIAEFIRNLMATGDFLSVDLIVSEQQEIAGVKTKKFDLACVLKLNK